MIWMMFAGAFVVPIAVVCVGFLNVRGEKLSWQAFKKRRMVIDILLAFAFALSLGGQFFIHTDVVIAIMYVAAGLPIFLFGRKIGYMQAFFNDKHNWTRKKVS